MGLTGVVLEIANLDDRSKSVKGTFLVDSGSAYTVLPKKLVDKLGLKAVFKKDFSLADGRRITRKIGNAYIKFDNMEAPSPVVLGKEKDTPLLGVLTLETFGLILDPFERKIRPAKLPM